MHEVYEEYKKENPDELVGVNALLLRSVRIATDRRKRQEKKLALIEECRRKLNGEEKGEAGDDTERAV